MILFDDRTIPAGLPRDEKLVPVRVDCPECGGRGETVVAGSGHRDASTGAWDCDTIRCLACEGAGGVPSTDAVVCTVCNTETVWLGQGCPVHNDVCVGCRPRGCGECADDEGGWDAAAYYGGAA